MDVLVVAIIILAIRVSDKVESMDFIFQTLGKCMFLYVT